MLTSFKRFFYPSRRAILWQVEIILADTHDLAYSLHVRYHCKAGSVSGELHNPTSVGWAGYRSRYSDWLRAGRSAGRIQVGGEIFRTCPDRPWGPSSLLYNGSRDFPGGRERPGRDADPSPPSSAVVKKELSYTSTPPMDRTACTEPQCLYKGALYLYFY